MYLLPAMRKKGLNIYYNNWNRRSGQGFPANLIETASVLIEAVKLYESSGYQQQQVWRRHDVIAFM